MTIGYNIPPPARAKFGVDEMSLDQMNDIWGWKQHTQQQQKGENIVKESLQSHQYECSGVQQQSDQFWLPDGLIQCTGICAS